MVVAMPMWNLWVIYCWWSMPACWSVSKIIVADCEHVKQEPSANIKRVPGLVPQMAQIW